ncbi:MAG: ABC transporter permease, partial [Microcystaceae cyanobacterium]
ILTLMSLIVGMTGGLFVAYGLYDINPTVFLKSVRTFMELWDIISSMVKAMIFGSMIAVIGCSWGLTTTGGAKGVGQSTTTAVVTSLLGIFVVNFFLSWVMFQGTGDAQVGN